MSPRKLVKNLTLLLVLILLALPLVGQEGGEEDPLLTAFLENFNRANDETKLDILRDSVNYEPQAMGPLYAEAVLYAVNSSDQLPVNTDLQAVALLAVQLAGLSGYSPAANPLWELFNAYPETGVRVAVLDALKADALGNDRTFQLLNRWMERQISVFRAGSGINTQVIAEAVLTLGSFNDPRAFPNLLSVSVLGLSQEISSRAETAMGTIEGDYAAMVTEVIEDYPPPEKLVALRSAVDREGMSSEEKAGVCIAALRVGNGLALSDPGGAAQVRDMRIIAARTLRSLNWAEAVGELIEHFDLCILEYDRGLGTKSALLEAIAALGSTGTREAAVRLALYLDVINSFVESNQGYDEQITLAVVRNLGQLRSKAGLNALLYLGYLDYSKTIRDAAAEARRAILGQ